MVSLSWWLHNEHSARETVLVYFDSWCCFVPKTFPLLIAMTCNIEPHVQCIWSIETESNGRRSCCFDEPFICPLNYLLHYDCVYVHETQSLGSSKDLLSSFFFNDVLFHDQEYLHVKREIRFESLLGHQIPICHSCNVSHRRLAQLVKNVQHCTFQNCKVL